MQRTRIAQILSSGKADNDFTVMGWVRTKRDSKGGFSFIEINDGSSFSGLQIIADQDLSNYQSHVLKLQTGCSIIAGGTLAASPGKGQKVELKADVIQVGLLR